jgi:hypothetical protein
LPWRTTNLFLGFDREPIEMPEPRRCCGRTRNRLAGGLSATSHYAAAFSSPARAFAGRVSFHTAAAMRPYWNQSPSINLVGPVRMIRRAQTSPARTPCAIDADGLFYPGAECAPRSTTRKIDRSLAIVVEATQSLNRAIFPLKSRVKKFDGLTVGFRPSAENFCAYKSARYDVLRE